MGDRVEVCFYGEGRLSKRAYYHWGGNYGLVSARTFLADWSGTDPDDALEAYIEDMPVNTDRCDPNPRDALPLPLTAWDWDGVGDLGLVVVDLEARLVVWANTRHVRGVDVSATVLAAPDTAPTCPEWPRPCPTCGYDGFAEHMLCGARDHDLPAWTVLGPSR